MKRVLVWGAAVAAVGLLSTFTAMPRQRTDLIRVPSSSFAPEAPRPNAPATAGKQAAATRGVPAPAAPGQSCAPGSNGGATDTGVSDTEIALGATVVDSGIGAAFLSDVRYGMNAVVDATNAAGGICGRRLRLALKDDGWDPARGAQFLQNLIEGEHVFALAVVPSSEGLRVLSRSGYLRDHGVPVVGTDGMLVTQYTDPMIFPVAASTITAMHVMAKDAYARGRRHFAIVYDSNYHFGVEGSYAFNAAVRRLTTHDIPGYRSGSAGCDGRVCGIRAGQPSYQTELQTFRSACDQPPRCDYIAYLMEPATAQVWMQGGGIQAGYYPGATSTVDVGGPQPLFNRSFGSGCSRACHGTWVWTGFTPAVEPFTSTPPVNAFVQALRATNAQADPNNSFVEGGYVGMKLLVDALRSVGPNLTRANLIAALDATHLDTGLSRPLAWQSGAHFANRCVRAFSIQAKPSFAGWRSETDWICDPWAGLDIPPGE